MKNNKLALIIIILMFILTGSFAWAAPPKYVFFFIGDGMGPEQVKAAGMYRDGQAGGLSFESFTDSGTLTTYSANNSITDSAAAGTALATGEKVKNKVISAVVTGDYPNFVQVGELETLLEWSQDQDKMVGLVTTTYMTHATPAAFGAHEPKRDNNSQIGIDYFTQTKPNVLFGGTLRITSSQATSAGYTVVTNRTGMEGISDTATLVSGQFSGGDENALPWEYQRDTNSTQPHLHEMVESAIDVLDNDSDGFFMMVEGGLIDWACHDRQLERAVHETIEFSNAVQVAIDWVAENNITDYLILVTADHETNGLEITNHNGEPNSYPTVTWSGGGEHTAANVPVYAKGVNAQMITGVMNNTDMFGVVTNDATLAVLYVDKDATGDNDGSSWADAFVYLQDALDDAVAGQEIWVAEGTYYPDDGDSVTEDTRSETFQLINGVEVYGGFDATETALSQRDISGNVTILSGEIGNAGVNTDNSYHVVQGANNAIIDGFSIVKGYANAYGDSWGVNGGGMCNVVVHPTVSNCTFTDNYSTYGGGMYNSSASPTVTNCTFVDNSAVFYGGAVCNHYSPATFFKCTFSDNNSSNEGGGMHNYNADVSVSNCIFADNVADDGGGLCNKAFSETTIVNCVFVRNLAADEAGGGINNDDDVDTTLINCTFSENTANYEGGGLYNHFDTTTTVINCIFWGNEAEVHGDNIYNYDETAVLTVTYSDVEGGYSGTGNVDIDPKFEADDYHLSQPGVAGVVNEGTVADYGDIDIDDENRVMRGTVDMGADELDWPSGLLQQKGDADGDGKVEFCPANENNDDYDKWELYYSTATYSVCCDFDRDGDIDLADKAIGLANNLVTGDACSDCQGL